MSQRIGLAGSEVILFILIELSHRYYFDWNLGDNCAGDFQKMRKIRRHVNSLW